MKSFLDILQEEKSDEHHHVMAFGRMNPPTTGHLKLIDKVKEVAHKHNATHSVVVSHTQDSKKNPLSGEQKLKHLKRYDPEAHFETSTKEHPTFLHHAEKLHKKGVTHLHMVAGSDRVKEYKEKLHQYNGTHKGALYNFKKITVHSAGHRDPDSEDSTEGMSGSKMREHAKNKNFHEFRKGVPSHVSDAHAKELMHDTRKGMGLHEDVDRGLFKAIFVTGGPGSGKDVIIREAIAEGRIAELNFIQARDYLGDKHKLSEHTKDFRREAIRNRGPLIINGPADDNERISQIKEELEELGYETMMVFVDTSDEVSKERNSLLSRMMMESVRQDKWVKSQRNTKYFTEAFKNFVPFDNTGDIQNKEHDIHQVYDLTKEFLDSKVTNETALDWLITNHKSYINYKLDSLFKEEKNVQTHNRFIQKIRAKNGRSGSSSDSRSKRVINDNNSPVQQLARKFGKQDDIRDGDIASNSSYTFRTYESKESSRLSGEKDYQTKGVTVKIGKSPKEPNFQKDNDKEKVRRRGDRSGKKTDSGQPDGLSPTWNSRTNGEGLTGGAGLGNQTYSESECYSNASPASTAMPAGVTPNPLSSDYATKRKDFKKFRKEAMDDPGTVDMGVGGTLGGASNKEPLITPNDNKIRATDVIKKKKKK